MAIAYLNATKLSVRQMKRPLSHPHLTVHAQQIEIEVIHSVFIYFCHTLRHYIMKGITFKKMGQHAPTTKFKLLPFGLFTSTDNYSACLFIKEKEIPERFEAFKG